MNPPLPLCCVAGQLMTSDVNLAITYNYTTDWSSLILEYIFQLEVLDCLTPADFFYIDHAATVIWPSVTVDSYYIRVLLGRVEHHLT